MKKCFLFITVLAVAFFAPVFAEPGENEQINNTEKHWTLEECLQYGVSSHPQIKMAASNVAAGKARLLQSRAGHDPQLSLRANWNHSKTDTSTRPITDATTDSTSESVALSKTLYDSGQRQMSENAARESLAAANARYDSTLTEVAAAIKAAFFRAQQSQALLQVRLETLDGYERHLEKVRGFVEVGSRAPYDITRAQVDVANARVDLISTRSQLKVGLANLARTIGLDTAISIAGFERVELPTVDSSSKEQLRQEALQRPEIRSADFQRKASSYSVKEAQRSLKPSLSASANYQWAGTETPLDRQWGMGVSMSWPVFDGSITRARIDTAKSQLDNSTASLENLRLSVTAELENSITGVSDAAEKYDATNYLVQQASESLYLAEARYDAGLSSPIEITDARVEFARARGNQVVTYFDGLIAWTELERVLGRLPAEIRQITIQENLSSDGSPDQ
ncbi:MAG: TolC family protein [Candidatus Riflebacteria bacterium]|nr:TolC family protein [Candidatus Riflebacteria bacterium]